jgi:hypothetical protein
LNVKRFAPEKREALQVFVLSFAIPSIFYAGTFGSGPTILTDELTFSRDILYASPWEASLGNPLQILLLGWTRSIDAWYDSIRLIQFAIFVAGIAFTYLLFRKFADHRIAFSAAFFYAIFPTWIFLSTTMAEGLLVGLVPIFLYFLHQALNSTRKIDLSLYLLFGSILTLIKPHSLLLVGLSLLLVRRSPIFRELHSLVRLGVVLGLFISTRAAVGLALGGPASLAPFGRYFSLGFLNETLQLQQNEYQAAYLNLLPEAATLFGKVDAFQVAFASLPLYLGFWLIALSPITLLSFRSPRSSISQEDSVTVLLRFLSVTLNLTLLLSWVFGVYISIQGDSHADRLLLRYFEYLLAFAYVLFAIQMTRLEKDAVGVRIAITVMSLASYILFVNDIFRGINISWADSIFFGGLLVNEATLLVFLSGILLSTYSAYFSSQKLVLVGFAGALSLVVSSSQLLIIRELVTPETGTSKEILSKLEDRKLHTRVLFMADSRANGATLLFGLNDLSSKYSISAPTVAVRAQAIPEEFETVVFVGPTLAGEGFSIIEQSNEYIIAKRATNSSSSIKSWTLENGHILRGKFAVAPGTIWATTESVNIDLAEIAPAGSKMEIEIQVHEFFKGGELMIKSGAQVEKFEVPAGGRVGVVSFILQESTQFISLEFPITELRLPDFSDRFGLSFGIGIKALKISP